MPLNKHYGGHGAEVMANMTKEYGSKKGERIFYATENKMKNRSVMGRKVKHHSPDQHPQQGDQMTPEMMDKMVEEAAKQSTGTYSNQRQIMKPMQAPMPRDTTSPGGIMSGAKDYLNRLLGGPKQ